MTTTNTEDFSEELTTQPITLRPKRTTTPMPTEENPLLRFYPVEEEETEESNEIPQMLSDEGVKHSERSSPMTDFFGESASGARWNLCSTTAVFIMAAAVILLGQ